MLKWKKIRLMTERSFSLTMIPTMCAIGITMYTINHFLFLPTENAWEIRGTTMRPLTSFRLRHHDARIFFFEHTENTEWETPRVLAWTKIEKFGPDYQAVERRYWATTRLDKEQFLRHVVMNPGFTDSTEHEYVSRFNTYWWTRFLEEHQGILAANKAEEIKNIADAWFNQNLPRNGIFLTGIANNERVIHADHPKPVL